MRSVMSHNFANIPSVNIPRSQFNRSCGLKTTFDAGYLVPVFLDEALPGDTFNLNMSVFARLATPEHPIMDNMKLSSFFFAVPYRLVWNNWEKFNGAQTDPGDSTDFVLPTMTVNTGTGYAIGSLSDYFGLPTGVDDYTHMSLFHRAYNLIWNEWFRDENLQDSVVVDKDDGPDTTTDYVLLRRGKRHDYFTSCLPWPQKGDEVGISLTGNAPVIAATDGTTVAANVSVKAVNSGLNRQLKTINSNTEVYLSQTTDNDNPLLADLSDIAAITINALREAVTTQQLFEKDARGGTRYTEIIRAHFGVVSPDARMQRPEYLGGGTAPVNVNPVPQTSSTDVTTPQGNLAAFGTVSARGHGFTKSFTEHCLIIGLVCVDADLTYQQGLNRMWSRSTRYDFYWPTLANLGEQAVLNKEIFLQGTAGGAADDTVFGYQERYAEYRYKPSQVTGLFRSNAAGTLDVWHLAEDFASLPTLNSTFIVSNPPIDRVISVPAEPHFLFDSYFDLKCARPMPVFSVPGLTRF